MEPSIAHIVWNCSETKVLRDKADGGKPIRMPADKAEERLLLASIAERPQPCKSVEGRPPDDDAVMRMARGAFSSRFPPSPILVAVDGGAGAQVGAWAVGFSYDQKKWRVAGDTLAGEELNSFVAEIDAQRRALEALTFCALEERQEFDVAAPLITKIDEDKLLAVLWCGSCSELFKPDLCDVVLITDCRSAIAFAGQTARDSKDHILQHKEIRHSLLSLARSGLIVALVWVPSHDKHDAWRAPRGFEHIAFRKANMVVDEKCTAVMRHAPAAARDAWHNRKQSKARWSACALRLAVSACLEYEKWFLSTYSSDQGGSDPAQPSGHGDSSGSIARRERGPEKRSVTVAQVRQRKGAQKEGSVVPFLGQVWQRR